MVEGEGMDVASSRLLEAARPRLDAGAVDLEIRERAIECVGDGGTISLLYVVRISFFLAGLSLSSTVRRRAVPR